MYTTFLDLSLKKAHKRPVLHRAISLERIHRKKVTLPRSSKKNYMIFLH